ncbi:MAG: alpha/beta hydrolase [Gammaproteobacteria bacterium]
MLIPSDLKNNYGFDFPHKSAILNKNKIARVLIPKHAQNNKIPVCYLLPPFGTNRFFWLKCLKNLYDQDKLPYVVVIPESCRNWFINDARGLLYEDYFIQELIPKVESELSSQIHLEKRIIGGFSMGGAAAIFLGLRYPDHFNLLFSIAGAFDAASRIGDPYEEYREHMELMMPTIEEHEKVWGKIGSETRNTYNLPNLIQNLNLEKWNNKIILETGTNDYPRIISMNREANNIFNLIGLNHSYTEQSGKHNDQYAEEAINRIFKQFNSRLF